VSFEVFDKINIYDSIHWDA